MIFGKKKKTYLSIFLTQSRVLISYLDFDRKTSVLVERFESEVADTAEFAKFLESVLEEVKKKYSDTPKEAIFFLSSFYIDTATRKVKKAFMKEFIDIFDNLSLKGIGYIETQEAVAVEREEFKVKTASHFVFVELESDRAIATLMQDKRVIRSASAKILGEKLSAIKEAVGEVIGSYKPLFFIFTLYEGGENLKKSLREKYWLKSLNLPEDSQMEFVEMNRLNELLLRLFQSEVEKENEKEDKLPVVSPQKKEEVKKTASSLPFGFSESDAAVSDEDPEFAEEVNISSPKMNFPRFSLASFFGGFSIFTSRFRSAGRGRFVFFLGVIFSLLAAFFIHSYFIHTLILRVVPVSKDIEFAQEIDEQALASIVDYKEEELDIQASISTSGNKEVGEKARGEISIYNFSTKDFSLSKGEKIKIKDKDFVILSSVDLPPAEEATVEGSIVKKPAVKKVQIEAVEIGEEYNLSTSEKIKIGDLDTDLYYAKLEGSTKGGSKEDLDTVARSDLESLREEVKRKASEDMGSKAVEEDGFIYMPELNEVEIVEEEFDKEVGEVADQVSLKAKVRVRLARLAKDRLLEYFKDDLQDQLPEGFSYNSDSVNLEYERIGNETVSFQVKIQLKAFKDINLDRLRSELAFKPLSYLRVLSEKNSDIERIEVLENKSFLPFFNFTPANPGKIQLVL